MASLISEGGLSALNAVTLKANERVDPTRQKSVLGMLVKLLVYNLFTRCEDINIILPGLAAAEGV